jgi:hypothetical protein
VARLINAFTKFAVVLEGEESVIPALLTEDDIFPRHGRDQDAEPPLGRFHVPSRLKPANVTIRIDFEDVEWGNRSDSDLRFSGKVRLPPRTAVEFWITLVRCLSIASSMAMTAKMTAQRIVNHTG